MSTYKTRGIILRRTNYGEADRIITFLTPDRGKLSALAKGIRRMQAKLSSHLELFNEAELMLVSGKNLDIVTSARVSHSFSSVVSSYETMRLGFLMCEMINRLTPENTSSELYELLKGSLASLVSGVTPVLVELYFKLHLLDQLGYAPNLEEIAADIDEVESASWFFNPEKGRVVGAQESEPHQSYKTVAAMSTIALGQASQNR
jgi:DNA repair protein RecO (recombination protein O)